MNRLLTLLTITLILIIPMAANAESIESSFSLNGGYFMPDVDGWESHYDAKGAWTGGAEFGNALTEGLELNINLSYLKKEGSATTPTGRVSTDTATYEQVPIHVSLSYRLLFQEDQAIVPYIGGGYTHVFYREKINGDKISGDRMGYHLRGGLQLLLDHFDPETAKDFSSDWNVLNTYLTFEAIYSKVNDFGNEDIDLGGLGYMAGLRFEY